MREIQFGDQDEDEYSWFNAPGYNELIRSMELEVLVEQSFGSYQGDSLLLVKEGDRFGILEYGWGSCSGCDALEACSTKQRVISLRDALYEGIQWFDSAEETVAYLRGKDWDLEWWGDEHGNEFGNAALVALGAEPTIVAKVDKDED